MRKQKDADAILNEGFGAFAQRVPAASGGVLNNVPVKPGVAII